MQNAIFKKRFIILFFNGLVNFYIKNEHFIAFSLHFPCTFFAFYIVLQENCKMNKTTENDQLPKDQRINKANLKKIGFALADSYEDHEIGFTVFKHNEIEVTIENQGWYCEIIKRNESFKMIGVTSLEHISMLKSLMYGE